jgi:hypothetical protein
MFPKRKKSVAALDVNQGPHIRRILSQLGLQLGLSTWHIAECSLRMAQVRMTSIRCKFTLLQFIHEAKSNLIFMLPY